MKKVLAVVMMLEVLCVPSWGAVPDKDIIVLHTNA